MRLWWILAALAVGCARDQHSLTRLQDDRPTIDPPPTDVQEEMRDARFFLPVSDDRIGPSAEVNGRSVAPTRSSQ